MAYDKTIWIDDETPISATNLNKIEQGISDLDRVTGYYTGDGAASRFISLGFTPKAVVLCRSDGATYKDGPSIYGGLAVTGRNVQLDADNIVLSLAENGFYVYRSSASTICLSNSNAQIFQYTAFR